MCFGAGSVVYSTVLPESARRRRESKQPHPKRKKKKKKKKKGKAVNESEKQTNEAARGIIEHIKAEARLLIRQQSEDASKEPARQYAHYTNNRTTLHPRNAGEGDVAVPKGSEEKGRASRVHRRLGRILGSTRRHLRSVGLVETLCLAGRNILCLDAPAEQERDRPSQQRRVVRLADVAIVFPAGPALSSICHQSITHNRQSITNHAPPSMRHGQSISHHP